MCICTYIFKNFKFTTSSNWGISQKFVFVQFSDWTLTNIQFLLKKERFGFSRSNAYVNNFGQKQLVIALSGWDI